MAMTNCGIYIIINLTNGHRYVGSSCNVLLRWQRHQENLRKGNHHSRYLQRAWNLHGENNFKFIFLQECERNVRLEKEQEWMSIFHPEYNMAKQAKGGSYPGVHMGVKRPDVSLKNKTMRSRGHTGCLHSEETRAKMRAASQKGDKLSPERIKLSQDAQRAARAKRKADQDSV
jgi:group I intron endonuclease